MHLRLPGTEEVHVWRIGLEDDAVVRPVLASWLSEDEQARARRFIHEPKRRQFTVARGVLRQLLAAYTGQAPEAVGFGYGTHGKPFLARREEAADLRFNLSHSRTMALCAVALGREVGVDVEYMRRERANQALARRFFSAGEVEQLTALPEAERPEAFYRCWTSKEAYVKALGDGLQCPLDAFEVAVNASEAALLRVDGAPDAAARWQLRTVPVPAGYVATCAAAGTGLRVEIRDWPPDLV